LYACHFRWQWRIFCMVVHKLWSSLLAWWTSPACTEMPHELFWLYAYRRDACNLLMWDSACLKLFQPVLNELSSLFHITDFNSQYHNTHTVFSCGNAILYFQLMFVQQCYYQMHSELPRQWAVLSNTANCFLISLVFCVLCL
jgi:hypothetical protein